MPMMKWYTNRAIIIIIYTFSHQKSGRDFALHTFSLPHPRCRPHSNVNLGSFVCSDVVIFSIPFDRFI